MHPTKTRNEFLRLRVGGLSLARIGRQLGVSKPTLIAWNRQSRAEIASRMAEDQQRLEQQLATSAGQQLADLKRRHTALRQELFSRAMRDIPTSAVETLDGELRQRIQELESATNNPECSAGVPPLPECSPAPGPSDPGLIAPACRADLPCRTDAKAGAGRRPKAEPIRT